MDYFGGNDDKVYDDDNDDDNDFQGKIKYHRLSVDLGTQNTNIRLDRPLRTCKISPETRVIVCSSVLTISVLYITF